MRESNGQDAKYWLERYDEAERVIADLRKERDEAREEVARLKAQQLRYCETVCQRDGEMCLGCPLGDDKKEYAGFLQDSVGDGSELAQGEGERCEHYADRITHCEWCVRCGAIREDFDDGGVWCLPERIATPDSEGGNLPPDALFDKVRELAQGEDTTAGTEE